MAIFHSHIQIISRGKGKSAVAAAAYRAGESITNDYDGVTHDYTRKGGIVHTEILLPENAPTKYYERAILWNAVEKIEKSKNSQLAREINIALPIELTREQNIILAREYVQHTFVDIGMCADLCIHDTGKGNPHAHTVLCVNPGIISIDEYSVITVSAVSPPMNPSNSPAIIIFCAASKLGTGINVHFLFK